MLYEYKCKACNHRFFLDIPLIGEGEKRRYTKQAQTPRCPKCKSKNTQKIISAPAIHYKGTGFYVTDKKK